jgi:23S rRNA (cytidine2498-2'-O)-methyltransferase
MMSQFFFALTNPEAEYLLKQEVQLHSDTLKFSYSRPGFLTFKGEESSRFLPRFARVYGKCLGKFKSHELNFERAWVWARTPELIIPPDLAELSKKTRFKIGEMVTLIMLVGPEEYWVGEYKLLKTHFQTPGEVSSIEMRDVPSRAYYKIAEANESFDLPFDHQERVLELGSAPGGATLFLLENDLRILGVDPAEMDPKITRNMNFKHFRMPFEQLNESHFADNVDWIISDVNLPSTVVLREVHRLLDFLEPKGLVLTLKINQARYLSMLDDMVSEMKDRGFDRVELKYFPSHRQEICLVALKSL